MSLVVQKYGGSSLSTVEKLRRVAEKVIQTRQQGYAVVVVVSAMGDSTDLLLDLAREVSHRPPTRELDLLLATGETVSTALLTLAIQNQGVDAIALSASQCGIITNDAHSNARILEIRTQRIKKELAQGAIVIIPGFVGVTRQQEVTTLGRGGSDTTAVALAAALDAESCVIFSDVDGVYSADPRMVAGTVKLAELDARVMQEMAWHGAQILKAEAVELASKNNVALTVRSTFDEDSGTVILPECDFSAAYGPRRSAVAGVSGRKDLIQIAFEESPQHAIESKDVFALISEYDLVFGTAGAGGPTELFISNLEIVDPETFAWELSSRFEGRVKVAGGLGAVSLVGFGLGSNPAALQDALIVLEEKHVPLITSFSGRESLTFVISRSEVDEVVRAMHRVFVEDRASTSKLADPLHPERFSLYQERTDAP